MVEEWKDIPISPRYAVSNYGRVMNKDTGRVLKPRPTVIGYLRVHIKRKELYIHRLVAEAFCNHPEGNNVVNHIDFNVSNNRADNLEWITQRSNCLYSMSAGRVPRFPNAVPVVGEKNGEFFIFRTAHEAGQKTGCDHSSIIKCCKGRYRSCKGYKWKYAEQVVIA